MAQALESSRPWCPRHLAEAQLPVPPPATISSSSSTLPTVFACPTGTACQPLTPQPAAPAACMRNCTSDGPGAGAAGVPALAQPASKGLPRPLLPRPAHI